MKHISKSASLTLILAFAKQVAMTDALHRWATACSTLSSSSRSSRMIFKGMMCCAVVIVCVSCRSVSSVQEVRSSEVQKFRSVDTVVVRDSVFVSERQRGDTVYLTRTEWRDRWRVRLVHDTIHDTQYVERVVEHPPERYVPKFYRWCTIALWAIGLSAIGYWLVKWWLRRRL